MLQTSQGAWAALWHVFHAAYKGEAQVHHVWWPYRVQERDMQGVLLGHVQAGKG